LQEHAKEITKMRQEFDLNAKELQQKSDRKVKVHPNVISILCAEGSYIGFDLSFWFKNKFLIFMIK